MIKTNVFIALASLTGAASFNAYPASHAAADRLVEVIDLNPFTGRAQVPASANLSSFKLQRIKLVQVPTRRIATSDKVLCDQATQDPGGAASCTSLTHAFPVSAFEITYSFDAPAMASDEYAGQHFTFKVYFRPQDLDAALIIALRDRRLKRLDLEPYFQVSTARDTHSVLSLDVANSTSCEGNYWEGNWVRADPDCKERLTYKTVAIPSGYLTVKVTPASPKQTASK